MLTLMDVYELAPLSERTLARHRYKVGPARLVNDTGRPCFYRVVMPDSVDLGAIAYYGGRRLAAYERMEEQPDAR